MDTMPEALEVSAGIVQNIPFWHDDLMGAAALLQDRMLALENADRLTEDGSKALGWLNYLYATQGTNPAEFLTKALAYLFLKPDEYTPEKHPCRTVADGIIKFSGLDMTFSE